MPNILNKFTTHLKRALAAASEFAAQEHHQTVNPEHLLLGLALQRGSLASEILLKAGLNADRVKLLIREKANLSGEPILPAAKPKPPRLSPQAKRSLEKAGILASKHRHKYIGTEHLLSGLLELEDETLQAIIHGQNLNLEALKGQLAMVLRSTTRFPDLTQAFEQEVEGEPAEVTTKGKSSKTPALEFFSSDLTNEKLQQTIDPVIGRKDEIERVIHILARRTKNNPVLIGDPGVGKTAIVEGLAKKITQGVVPDVLLGKRILRLDLPLVVAGTMYRGEFESRLKQIIDEVRSNPNLILFIDELHTIIGAGSASGSMDAANILKPALARGEIRCIGATTLDEYRKHVESDSALERRFQPVMVEEPSAEETVEILKGLKSNYEKYHRVTITDEAIRAAVTLSQRYLQDKFLPDKAIDLIDESASKLKVRAKPDGFLREVKRLEDELRKLEQMKEKAVFEENFKEALEWKAKEEAMREQLRQLRDSQSGSARPVGRVTQKDVAEIVSQITKVPLAELVVEEKQRLVHLEDALKAEILGQDEAIHAISDAIRRSRVGLANANRPIGSFIFLGPSGVGKTETAKVLARRVFEDEKALIRIDMSEFAESFNLSKLIGAPAGYVGYKEGNKLTEPVRRKPYAVVLFDEIEKAHPEVFNILLQVLEDGHLTDATGKKVNFKNTIVIMTSNIGLQELNRGASIGFESETKQRPEQADKRYDEIKEDVLRSLRDAFRPEFLNRVDKIIVFRPLTKKAVEGIVKLQLDQLAGRAKQQGIALAWSDAAVKWIAKKGFSPDEGARAIRKVIEEQIENPLAQRLLTRGKTKPERVTVAIEKDKLVLNAK